MIFRVIEKYFCLVVWVVLSSFYMLTASAEQSAGAKKTPCPTNSRIKQRKFFQVCAASTHLQGDVYIMDIKVYYGLSKTVSDALDSGVPITFAIQIEINKQRKWIWDETIATLNQRFRIKYHALTRKYIVINLNSNAHRNYPSKEIAVAAISDLKSLPLIDSKLMVKTNAYYGRLRAKLVVGELPSPLRLWAYLSADWRMKSEWFEWQL